MQLLTPLSDELGWAYLYRLCRRNVTNGRPPARASHLSILDQLQMTQAAWIREHCMTPAWNLVINVGPRETWMEGAIAWPNPERALGTGTTIRLCRHCVAHDLEVLGFSYWRRVHQLRGVTWCVDHRRALSEARGPNPLARSPQAAIADSSECEPSEVEPAMKSDVLNRFASVLRSFLTDMTWQVGARDAAELIELRAKQVGLGAVGHATSSLTHLAELNVPARWYANHAPKAYRGKPYTHIQWISSAANRCWGPAKTESCALALALLWERPDEASKALLGCGLQRPYFWQLRNDLDIESMSFLWLRHKGSTARIARATRRDPSVVEDEYGQAGLGALTDIEFDRAQATAADMIRQGDEIPNCMRFDAAPQHVKRFLYALGGRSRFAAKRWMPLPDA